ncbi:DNA gyrase inhibitor YacG [Rhodoferax sp.]|uniref:DNA gyrase inhibitor YacG n=1 Tax=Rhodoferax sp. TaxID=50421 RepID=UPI00274CEDF0|nr:DNA gyrase inhibitor YacG [Rhodoferax sp.]
MNPPETLETQPPRTVTCPTCSGDSIYGTSNPHRPFCGERCRNIDLGNWANEDFRVQLAPDVSTDLTGPCSID